MSVMERIPKDFYKLFSSKYTDYYMLFLTAIYEEMSLSYSVLGLTEKECRAVMNEKIAAAALLRKIMMKRESFLHVLIWRPCV